MRVIISLVILALIAIGAYAAYWFFAADRIRTASEEWALAREAEGWIVSYESFAVTGFPGAHRVTLTGLDMAAPQTQGGWSAAAETLEFEAAAPWNFQSWTVLPGDALRLTLISGEDVLIAADSSILVLDFSAGAIQHFYAEAQGLSILAATAPLRAAEMIFMEGEREGGVWNVRFESRGAQIADGAFGDARAAFGGEIQILALDLQAGEEGLAALAAGGASLETAGDLTVNAAHLQWGVAVLSGEGALGVDGEGRLRGAFDVAMRDPAAFLGALAGAGVLGARQANIALAAVAFLPRDDDDRAIVPFSFRNGETMLGPVAIGPAPHVRAAPARP